MTRHERTTFFGLVHKDEDSAYGISFPDMPGCFSAADEADAILPNAMEALELWADDAASLPLSRDIEALRRDPDVAHELANGACLIAVPLIRNGQKSERINITLGKGLLQAIDEEAARRKMTRSGFLAQAAEREIGGSS